MTNIQTLENVSDHIIGQDSNNVMFTSPGKVKAQNRVPKLTIKGLILLPKLVISWNTTFKICLKYIMHINVSISFICKNGSPLAADRTRSTHS